VTLTQFEAMGLTLVLEAAVAAALAFPLARNPLRCAAAAIVASCLTHPILWAIFYDVVPYLGAYTTPVLEFVIMAAETLAYRAIATPRWSEAALLSIIANAASWGAGELIYALN
jgi:hypothetical protein